MLSSDRPEILPMSVRSTVIYWCTSHSVISYVLHVHSLPIKVNDQCIGLCEAK
jgi:hypothetical protein